MKKPFSKTAYLKQISLEDLHRESRNWLSTLEFWQQEVAFMLHLVEVHFISFVTNDKENTLQPLLVKINRLGQRVLETQSDRIEGHEAELAVIIKSPFVNNDNAYRQQHEILAKEMTELENRHRKLKAELVRIAKEVIPKKRKKNQD